jgi:hypothetical protein
LLRASGEYSSLEVVTAATKFSSSSGEKFAKSSQKAIIFWPPPANKQPSGHRQYCWNLPFPDGRVRGNVVCSFPFLENQFMGLRRLKLLEDEWRKLVAEREDVLRAVHQQKITFTEWNKRERVYVVRVQEALVRLKHAQTKAFCAKMVGKNPN